MMSEELEIQNENNEEYSSPSQNNLKYDVSKDKIGSFDESKLIQLFSNMNEKVRSLLENRSQRPAKIFMLISLFLCFCSIFIFSCYKETKEVSFPSYMNTCKQSCKIPGLLKNSCPFGASCKVLCNLPH